MKHIFALSLFMLGLTSLTFAQPSNDNCANAIDICINKTRSGTTSGASSQVCPTCADGPAVIGSACFQMVKTVWYSFTTNATGGNVTVNIFNVSNTTGANGIGGIIYSATTPCNANTYTTVSNCVNNSSASFSLIAAGLAPSTTYYVLLGTDSTTVANFDIGITGPGVELPPSTFSISNNVGATRICPSDVVTFTYTATNCDNPSVNWFVNGGLAATTFSNDPFTKDYFVDGDIVTAELVCECGPNTNSSNNLTMNVFPYITVDAGPFTNIPFGGSTQLNGTGGVTYSWNPSETLDDPNIPNPIATPTRTTTYVMTATSTDGCEFFADVIVNVIDSIYVPNTFTPNADGVNDTWEIKLIELFPKAEVTVFNRFGQEVFKTIGYPASRRWDGTRNGKKLPGATYYYTISLSIDSREERIKTGSVTIIY